MGGGNALRAEAQYLRSFLTSVTYFDIMTEITLLAEELERRARASENGGSHAG